MRTCPGPRKLSRRDVLEVGGASALGLGLTDLLRLESLAAGTRNRRDGSSSALAPTADACILIFLDGGPSHLDMWDMKPDAPEGIRGEFKPIPSSLPGLMVSEHLPRLARHMHLGSLIRSARHTVNNSHGAAVYTSLTGHDRGELGGAAAPTDYPAIGSVVGMRRPPDASVIPYVSMPYITAEGRGGPPQPGFFGGWLGRNADPLFMLKDPNDPAFAMPELALPENVGQPRMTGRKRLVSHLSGAPDGLGGDRKIRDLDGFQAKAFDLLTSPRTQKAFRLDQEDPRVRERYGRNIYGQSVLLARRLIESGTRLACISWAPDANATWDTHGSNFASLKNTLLPQFDSALASLLEDLQARRMLDRTLVVAMGEFGRSPRVNKAAGRDHWNYCYSLFLAGGGIRPGHVFGASDKIGAYPARQPVTPADIIATIYRTLGLPADLELHDRQERPFALVPWGSAIEDILT